MTGREAFEDQFSYIAGIPKDAAWQAWQAATAAERERCAKAVVRLDKEKWFPSQRDFAESCADAIRKGD